MVLAFSSPSQKEQLAAIHTKDTFVKISEPTGEAEVSHLDHKNWKKNLAQKAKKSGFTLTV